MSYAERALRRQAELTKPPGSLGRLEGIAVQLAGLQQTEQPASRPACAVIFASDHPVAKHGVSAYPASVTGSMMSNFAQGGAASTVFATQLGVPLEVVDVGVSSSYGTSDRLRREPVAAHLVGDIRVEDAMSAKTLEAAICAGRTAVDRLRDPRVLILGEMGIGNTTPASAITCSLLGKGAEDIVGPGTGLQERALAQKRRVVSEALSREPRAEGAEEVVRALGGREIAALIGAAHRAMDRGVLTLVDGFIVSAAMLAATRMEPRLADHLLFSHRSQEPGHDAILRAFKAAPLLDLQLRLGEATGALCALPLLDLACAMHNEMATFSEAGVEGPT